MDHWLSQPNYVELWYEARAMTQQFAYYTEHMTLRPTGGDPSIRYKWDTAQALTEAHQRYGKPITILYFGDLDKKGLSIAKTLERDVRKWAKCDFQFIRAGLNLEQVRRYGVPENFEHPGSYQWEALSDDAAREIITAAVGNLVSHDAFSALAEKEREVTAWFNKAATTLANEWSNHHE